MNTTTSINATTTLSANRGSTLRLNEGYFAKRNALDWVFAVLVAGGFLYAFARYSAYMDVYEKGILFGAIPATIAMGWFWRPLRVLAPATAPRWNRWAPKLPGSASAWRSSARWCAGMKAT